MIAALLSKTQSSFSSQCLCNIARMREEDFDSFPSQHHEPVIITRRPGTNDNFKSKIASPKIVETMDEMSSSSHQLRSQDFYEPLSLSTLNHAAPS
tara:strand:+ start:128 stop:415 length:288 start_codon:yes stop_codon:yes gene_type:complete